MPSLEGKGGRTSMPSSGRRACMPSPSLPAVLEEWPVCQVLEVEGPVCQGLE